VRDGTRRPAGGQLIYEAVGLATITLIVLKLAGVVTWSWWWVLTPLWINLAPAVLIVLALAVLIFRAQTTSARHWQARKRLLRDLFADH
jgi:predicted membrane chloride channel (bestrophin family)